MTPDARITELEAENAALREQVRDLPVLREQVAVLVAQVAELRARLAKDSHNSGKPPSSDGLRRKPKSLRQRSGKKPGGQLGPRGETLDLVATPDAVVEHRPTTCVHCQAALDAESAAVVLHERCQVWDLPLVRLHVIEYRALHLRCPACHVVTVGAFPPEAPSRAQYGPRLRALAVCLVQEQFVPLGRLQQLLADLTGVRLARGALVGWVQRAASTLAPVEACLLHRRGTI